MTINTELTGQRVIDLAMPRTGRVLTVARQGYFVKWHYGKIQRIDKRLIHSKGGILYYSWS